MEPRLKAASRYVSVRRSVAGRNAPLRLVDSTLRFQFPPVLQRYCIGDRNDVQLRPCTTYATLSGRILFRNKRKKKTEAHRLIQDLVENDC